MRFTTGPAGEPAEADADGARRLPLRQLGGARRAFRPAVPRAEGPDLAVLDPAALGAALVVRSWREGDRMRPLGLGGSKSLQDLFTDRKVPRSLRHALPVVTSDGRIVWIAGVAVSEEFAARPGASEAAVLSAAQVASIDWAP